MGKNKKSRKKVKDPEVMEVLIDRKTIEHVMVDLEVSQGELAKEMGIAAATLSRIVNERSIMSRPYCKLFLFTVKELERRTGKRISVVLPTVA